MDTLSSYEFMSMRYTPDTSAMANFVRQFPLPKKKNLITIGGRAEKSELQIGTLVRLHSRAGAKLEFTPEMKALFGHLSYTGPLSHEDVYRKVTTIGVNYYQYNKGMKERKVFLHGDLIRLPVQMGVVKLGTRPLRLDEVGSHFVMYRAQIVNIFIGELALQGNSPASYVFYSILNPILFFFLFFVSSVLNASIDSLLTNLDNFRRFTCCRFIPTGIRFYVGFGEESKLISPRKYLFHEFLFMELRYSLLVSRFSN